MRPALLLVLLLVAGCRGDTPVPHASGSMSPAESATAACTRLRLVEQGIRANSATATVRANLAEARDLATRAARQDARWVALSGGIAALDEALRRDDPAAAEIGLRVAREACGR